MNLKRTIVRHLPVAALLGAIVFCSFGASCTGQDGPVKKFLGDEDGVVFEVDLTKLLKSKDFEPLAELIDIGASFKQQVGFSVREIKLFAGSVSGPNEDPSSRFILQATRDIDPLQMMRMNRFLPRNGVPETKEYRDKTYYEVDKGREKLGVFQPDDKTFIVNRLEVIEDLVKGKTPKQNILRSKEWKALEDYQGKLALGEKLFDQWRGEYNRFSERGGPKDPILELLGPLNQKIVKAFGGIKLGRELSLRVSLFSASSEDARDINSSLQALLQIGKSMLGPMQSSMIDSAPDEHSRKMAEGGFAVLNNIIKSLKYERFGKEVRITANADIGPFVKNILPDTIKAAQIAARRTQSANNMKQLGLAMHNYYDVNKGMPPAVIIGPKGHKHSWRIAMLPYIEQQDLYDQYRLDEPWDSPNNKKVMMRMPEAFRHPNDPPGSTTTRYLAFVGKGTPFENPEGVQFRDILDGTSNTIMFFSGATNVPWTKPEDIQYDPEKGVDLENGPFENGFNAVFFDGSIRFLSKDVEMQQLHNMIQSNDGNPIPR